MSEEGQVIVRPVKPEDKNYIMSSWLHNQYYSSQYFSRMPQDVFFKEYASYIAKLFSNPDCKIDVAVLDSDLDEILGFVCYLPLTVHWIYVKNKYRNQRIMKLLVDGKAFTHYTGSTLAGISLAHKHNLTFNPFIS